MEPSGELYTPPSPLARHHRTIGWSLFGLALLARAAYLRQLHASPLWDDLPVDLAYYRDWALKIASGDWVGTDLFEQSPLYAYFLAGLFKLFGPGLLAPRLIQIVIGSLTCLLIYRLGRQVFSPGAGLAAGLMAALYGPFLFYDGMLMKEVFAVFLVTAMLTQLHEANASQRGMLASAGLCLGLAALVRDNTILLAPVMAGWLFADSWLRSRRAPGRIKEGIQRVAAFVAGLAIAVLPVTARNYHVSGRFVLLTAGGGEVFYIGNNPAADGRYTPPPFVRPSAAVEHEDFRREAARRLGREVTREEASDYWLGQGLGWIAAHPADWARLTGRKLLLFFNHYELPDNHSYDHHRELLPILKLPWLTFGWLAPIAAGGLALSWTRRRDLTGLYLAGAGYVATVLLFFNFGRFRMPAVPVLLVFAGYAPFGLAAAIRAVRPVRAMAGVAAAAGAFILVWMPLEDDPLHLGQSHAQLSELQIRAGRTEAALAESDRALALLEELFVRMGGSLQKGGHGAPPPGRPGRPDLGEGFYGVLSDAYATRSRILRALGREDEAARFVEHAASTAGDPEATPAALARRGRQEMEAGHPARAVEAFAASLEAMSSDPRRADPAARLRVSLRLAEALHHTGRLNEALEVATRALEEAPRADPADRADAHYGRALIYRELGQAQRAREELDECLRLNPSHPRADWLRQALGS